jgi:hypothetical protein
MTLRGPFANVDRVGPLTSPPKRTPSVKNLSQDELRRRLWQSRQAARLRRGCGWSAKLSEALRDGIRVQETRLRALAHERNNGGGEGCPELPGFDRANVGSLQSSQGRC